MKFFTTVALSLSFLAVGCTGYDITLSNGSKISGVSKPRLDPESRVYVFKDASGQPGYVNAGRVRVIEPHQRIKKKNYSTEKVTSSRRR